METIYTNGATQSGRTTATPAGAAPWLGTVEVAAQVFADAGKTQSAIRADIFKADDRKNSRGEVIPGNGLSRHRAIIRRGRKVLIDLNAYGRWLAGRDPADV